MNIISINELISDRKIISTVKNINILYKITFISTFIWGIFAHGMALFNKYSFHDDIFNIYYGTGATVSSGRWMLEIFNRIKLHLNFYYSIPVFYGLLVILLIAIINVLLVEFFSVKNIYFCIFLSGITIAFPTICSLFGYMFTSFYYTIGIFMAVFGAWLLCQHKHWYTNIIAVILMGSSLGVYQANIGIYVSFILLYMIKDTAENQRNVKAFCKYSLYYIICIVSSFLFYLCINKLALYVCHATLTDYQGISSMENISLSEYCQRILYAYRIFIFPSKYNEGDVIYSSKTIFIYWIVLCITVLFTAVLIAEKWKEHKLYAIELLILILLFPLAVNFSYVIAEPSSVYSLMQYSHIFLYVYFSWLISKTDLVIPKKNILQTVATVCIFSLTLVYCRTANTHYFAVELKQQRAISYFTTLVANIKSTENYKDDYSVVFINEKRNDLSFNEQDYFEFITYMPYRLSIVNNYSWKKFVKVWTGYDPVILEEDKFKDLPEVQNMPAYPDYGSIKVIDETVVVKF